MTDMLYEDSTLTQSNHNLMLVLMKKCTSIFFVAVVLIAPFSSLEAGQKDEPIMIEDLNDEVYLCSYFGVDTTYSK